MITLLFISLVLLVISSRKTVINWFWEIAWWKVVIATMSLGAFFAFVIIRIFS